MDDFGLYFFNARWYDPYLNHFTQPDTIVPNPGNPQDWNRYSYARNNPVRYTDPSGHRCVEGDIEGNCSVIDTKAMIHHIESKYAVRVEGRWDFDKASNLEQALGKYAKTVGGTRHFNHLLNQTAGGVFWSDTDKINIVLERGSPSDDICGVAAYACWDDNTITVFEEVFSQDYVDQFINARDPRRPSQLGLDNPDMSSQTTISHEITHAMADLFVMASIEYALNVDNAHAFGGSWEESMASAVAIYVASGGQDYPGYHDQMLVAKTILSVWGSSVGK